MDQLFRGISLGVLSVFAIGLQQAHAIDRYAMRDTPGKSLSICYQCASPVADFKRYEDYCGADHRRTARWCTNGLAAVTVYARRFTMDTPAVHNCQYTSCLQPGMGYW